MDKSKKVIYTASMRYHRLFGLRSRIFVSYSVIVTLLVLGVTAGLTVYLRSSLQIQETENLLRLVQKSAVQVEDNLQVLRETAVQVGLTPEIVDIFTALSRDEGVRTNGFESDYFDAGKKIVRTLSGIKYEHFSTGRISLYNSRGDYISYGRLPSSRKKTLKSYGEGTVDELSGQLEKLDGRAFVLDPHPDLWSDLWSENDADKLLSVLWNIKDLDYNRSFGIVEIQQSFEEIVRLVDPGTIPGTSAIMFGKDGSVLWQSGKNIPVDSIWAIIKEERIARGSALRKIAPTDTGKPINQTLVWNQANEGNWTIVYVRTEESILLTLKNSVTILLLSALLLMGFSIGAVLVLSIRLARPLQKLRRQIDQVDWNNLSVELETGADADVFFINQAFTQMFDRLQTASRQLVQSRVHETKAHLLALQSQMDPHFIFNILSVLSAEARTLKADRLVSICSTLAETLRYVSDYDVSHTTLETEFIHVKQYLELMRYRFEEGLEFSLSTCPNASKIAVPKLLLQPLVENCFRHGFADRHPPWKVHIAIDSYDGRWSVCIEDNGKGLSDEETKEILDRVNLFIEDPATTIGTMKIGGLGLVNSLVRLKLQYGDRSSFEIGKSETGGTRITLGGPSC